MARRRVIDPRYPPLATTVRATQSQPTGWLNYYMFDQLKSLLATADSRQQDELQGILDELTWDPDKNCYYGSQSAVARITGLSRPAITKGLGLLDDRQPNRPKLLTWLAAEGISAVTIQREWSAGRISDKYIAKLIVYAGSETKNRTVEGRRWLSLITNVGLRGAVHQMKGREDLVARAGARGGNLKYQRMTCKKIEQQGKSYQHTRSKLVQGVTTMVPRHLENKAKKQGIQIKDNWRSHADATTLGAVSMSELGYSITGDLSVADDVRQMFMARGWSGEVVWSQERINCDDARDMNKLAKRGKKS